MVFLYFAWDAGHCYQALYHLECCHLIIITDHSEMVDNLRIKREILTLNSHVMSVCGVDGQGGL